jgi:hypothetical protein
MKVVFGLGVYLMVAIAAAAPAESSIEVHAAREIHTESKGPDFEPSKDLSHTLAPRQPSTLGLADGDIFLDCWRQTLTVQHLRTVDTVYNPATGGMGLGIIPPALIGVAADTINNAIPGLVAPGTSVRGILDYVFDLGDNIFIRLRLTSDSMNNLLLTWVNSLGGGALWLSMYRGLTQMSQAGVDTITWTFRNAANVPLVRVALMRVAGPAGRFRVQRPR